MGDRDITKGLISGEPVNVTCPSLHDEPLAVGTGKTAYDGNAATKHEGLLQLLGDLEITTHLYRRAGAMDPGVAGYIHPDVGPQEGQWHIDLQRRLAAPSLPAVPTAPALARTRPQP